MKKNKFEYDEDDAHGLIVRRAKRKTTNMATKQLRTLITPVDHNLAVEESPTVFWKQVLPNDTVKVDGHTLRFDNEYHQDCIEAFRKSSPQQVAFQLATSSNSHGHDMDPERQRGIVTDLATLDQLPPAIREAVGENPGLYARLKFFSKKAARSVIHNPDLGVSARVRENHVDGKGNFIRRSVIHVLGTLDPVVTGMSPFIAATANLSHNAGVVIDLSTLTYKGEKMAKSKGGTATKLRTKKGKDGNDVIDIESIPDDFDYDTLSDEQITAFMAEYGHLADEDGDDTDDDDEDEDADDESEEDDDESDDEDEDEDDDDDDTDDEGTANLSTKAKRQIDMANSAAQKANARATEALRRQADAEWRSERQDWVRKGVAPADVDLAAAILNRPEAFVVDLSHEGGKRKSVDVSKIIRGLLESLEGTIDMSNESGHGYDRSDSDDDGRDNAVLDLWDQQHPLPGYKG